MSTIDVMNAQEDLRSYQEVTRPIRDVMAKEILRLDRDLRKQLQKHFEIIDISYGGWTCESSPIGECVYDNEVDPANDHCVVCGDPSERK